MSLQIQSEITEEHARKCAAAWTDGKIQSRGDWIDSRCPVHDDESMSLGIKLAESKAGKPFLIFKCHAGCDWKAIEAKAIDDGILPKWTPGASSSDARDPLFFWKSKGLKPVKSYPYRDEQGQLLFEKWRCLDENDEKTFRQKRPDGNGWWRYSLGDVRKVLYRLPELIKALEEGKDILILEGEKDCETAADDGEASTCNFEGGGKWNDSYTALFANSKSRVFLCLDNDHVGYEHLNLVGASFLAAGETLHYIEFPGIQKHGDYTNFREFFDHEMFEALKEDAAIWTAPVSNPWPKETKPAKVKAEAPKSDTFDATPPAVVINEKVVPLHGPDFLSSEAIELWTDAGNGKRLAKKYEGKIFYTPALGWLCDAGEVFKCDEAVVTEFAKETARELTKETNRTSLKELKKFTADTLNTRGISNMMKAAKTINTVRCDINDFDSDIYSLNTHSGLVDCSTGKVSPRTSANKCMLITSCEYSKEAFEGLSDWHDIEALMYYMPHWGSCLSIITNEFENMEMLRYLQELGGYWLTGSVKQQEAIIVHGEGENLKSQFLDNFGSMMGSYSHTVRAELFLKSNGFEKQDDNMSQLLNIRFAPVAELEKNAVMNLAKLKTFTGGKTDKVPARFLGKEPFAFVNKAKIAFRSNHLPQIRDTDRGIWRRVKQLDFKHTIKPELIIKGFEDLVLADYPAMLAWYMRGCIRQLERGKVLTPAFVEADTKNYKDSMDVFQHFMNECLEESPGSRIASRDMARVHRDFSRDYNYQELSAIKLGLALKEHGVRKDESEAKGHRTVYLDYKISDDYAEERSSGVGRYSSKRY